MFLRSPYHVAQFLNSLRQAEENLGTAMVFTIAEALKEWLVNNNVKALTEHEKIVERKKYRTTLVSADTEDTETVFNLVFFQHLFLTLSHR